MERAHRWLLILLVSFQLYSVYTLTCDPNTQYENAGRCCQKCKPGQKMVSECTETTETQCKECNDGEYQATWNQERACHLHRYCDNNAGLFETTRGTAVADAVCECMTGRHCSSEECATCVKNNPCESGYGVRERATHYSDTKCEPCPPGTFSSVSSFTEPCHNYTRCEKSNMVIVKPGTDSSDVVCGARSHMAVIVVVLSCVLLVLIAAIIPCCLYKKGKLKCLKKKIQKHDLIVIPFAQPVETDPDEFDGPPVQETLSGQQPVAQEEGKDSRIPQQERE